VDLKEILGTAAAITSLVYMGLGLPIQIKNIYKVKSTKGLSLFMICTLFATMMSWVIYAISITNWYIIVSNVPGALCAAVILFQFWLYRKPRE